MQGGPDRPRTAMPAYPYRSKTREEFLLDVRRATQTLDFADVQRFYMRTFDSYVELCALFKENPNQDGARLVDPDLKMDFLYAVHDALKEVPTNVHKSVLKSMINAICQENIMYALGLRRKDQVRALFMLVQNPLFCDQSSCVIYAQLLRRVVHLPASDHQMLVHWLKILEVPRLRALVRNVMLFLSVRQFPTADPNHTLPEPNKMRWWIPTAARMLAFINAANNSCRPPLLHFSELYNEALDHIDLANDYFKWQDPSPTSNHFSYCQYPFILSINAKRLILTKDSEQQQMINARRSLETKTSRQHMSQVDIFFLNMTVRRSHLVEDSLKEIQRASERKELKKKLRLTFAGEPGLDMGGLTKEWFQLLVREIFDPDKGMFVYHPHSRCYWFRIPSTARTWSVTDSASRSTTAPPSPVDGEADVDAAVDRVAVAEEEESLQQYNLIGVLMGLAVYNSNILDLRFPSVCYQKLLSPPVVPHGDMHLGVVRNPSLDDLAQIMPEVARGLRELLAYQGDVEQDMCLTFQASIEEFGAVKTFPLKQGGEEIPVTNTNRKEYVRLYLDWMLNTAVYNEFRSFYLGFHSVCASNALIMLRPEEVEMLVCGCPQFVLEELRKVTEYDGYLPNSPVIINMWSVLEEFSEDMRKRFLLFTTGSDRIPVGGAVMMTFKVSRALVPPQMLPQAHTCFNQLMLPEYPTKDALRAKLSIAVQYAEGFGLE
ncbi:probable E3 ubiquitin-protein ligase HECTD2 [Thrips palmi]|uniref:HECT-type E3 ubiquitin transferase n=1 Tax=Thrips palmi TaxID=161013 RepID=A0A6P8Z1F6_THRPL|nr:probable E3 ubiquitin-protein ligase HECTD2 [Thrips palmi]